MYCKEFEKVGYECEEQCDSCKKSEAMPETPTFNVGDKVNYFGENGIVKSLKERGAYVVYRCSNDWENHQNYTGVLTLFSHLKKGWV